jgi:1-deoxy-D-xylulose-5-phosphate reductoisomerase
MQNIAVLGATGSIGASTLDVMGRHPDRYRLRAVTAHRRADELVEICRRFRPAIAVLGDATRAPAIASRLREASPETALLVGEAGLIAAVTASDVDTVMAAIVGSAGLKPTLAAARARKRVLLANKEALVMAGRLFMEAVAAQRVTLLPVDSEHNAIFQCLPASATGRLGPLGVKRILLTGSGGPFRTRPIAELDLVTPAQACKHPNWSMGPKISVDSATMMNKALEVIEARWLFGASAEQIEVLVHPQSVVHSMVEYADGSVIAQLGNPDMRTPIAQALAYPDRIDAGVTSLDLARIGQLTFEPPDPVRFPALRLAYEVLASRDSAAVTLNAANEVAVDAFLDGRLRFPRITEIVERALHAIEPVALSSIDDVIAMDVLARARTAELLALQG